MHHPPSRDPGVFVKRRLERFNENGARHWPFFEPGAETHEGIVLYEPSQIIACARTTDYVEEQLARRFGERRAPDRRRDFSIFTLPEGVDSLDLASRLKCRDANVAPHPVLNLAQGVPRIGPGDDPRPCPDEGTKPLTVTNRFKVGVVDTGILKGMVAGAASTHVDNPDVAAPGAIIDWYGAVHGTFIAGIYGRRAGGVDIEHAKAVSDAGHITLDTFVKMADEAVEKGLDVLNLSLGLYRAPGLGIPGLRAAVKRWIARSKELGHELLIAAAAGNDSRSQRFYPAGFSDDPEIGASIMSVGALDHPDDRGEKRPAEFSNYGDWVNAWAPGVDLRSDYATDGLVFQYDANTSAAFHGLAEWSGTSFATPYAAAEVIRYADAHSDMSPLAAWHEIRAGRPWVLFD